MHVNNLNTNRILSIVILNFFIEYLFALNLKLKHDYINNDNVKLCNISLQYFQKIGIKQYDLTLSGIFFLN